MRYNTAFDNGIVKMVNSTLQIYVCLLRHNYIGRKHYYKHLDITTHCGNKPSDILFIIYISLFIEYGHLIGNSGCQGGVLFAHKSSCHILNTTFDSNHAVLNGGSLSISRGNTEIKNSVFKDNFVDLHLNYASKPVDSYWGGALYVTYAHLCIDNSHFMNNRACSGGDIYISGHLSIINSFFGNKRLHEDNQCSFTNGGAIYIINGTANIRNTRFVNNVLFYGIVNDDYFNDLKRATKGGGHFAKYSVIYISTSIFENNAATLGGAVFTVNGETHIKYTKFVNNTGSLYTGRSDLMGFHRIGGDIYAITYLLNLIGCDFLYNRATAGGQFI